MMLIGESSLRQHHSVLCRLSTTSFLVRRQLLKHRSAFHQLTATLFISRHRLCQRRSAFRQLTATLLRGQRCFRQCCSAFGRLTVTSFLGQCLCRRHRGAFGCLKATLLVGKKFLRQSCSTRRRLCQCLCSCSCYLSSLLLGERRTHAAFLLALQAGESGFALLSPGSHPGKQDLETVAENPQEDGACGPRPVVWTARSSRRRW